MLILIYNNHLFTCDHIYIQMVDISTCLLGNIWLDFTKEHMNKHYKIWKKWTL
jgi:Fe-S cluster assembly iron-binding protein IscA